MCLFIYLRCCAQEPDDSGGLLWAGEDCLLWGRLLSHRALDGSGPHTAGWRRGIHNRKGHGHGLPQLCHLPAGGTRASPGAHQEDADTG